MFGSAQGTLDNGQRPEAFRRRHGNGKSRRSRRRLLAFLAGGAALPMG